MNDLVSKMVLDQFTIGKVQSISRISSGLMHATLLVVTDQGRFVLQKLHPMLASQAIADDFLTVTTFLKSEGFATPACVLTTRGDVLAREGEEVWRMQTAIDGTSFDRIDDLTMIENTGEMLGRFHRTISKLSTPLKSSFVLPPNAGHVHEKFLHVLEHEEQVHPVVDFPANASKGEFVDAAASEIAFLSQEFPKLFLPSDLPSQTIHGDPKVSNFLFRDNTCVGLIDLDTCNRQSVLMELGDAFRSWCGGIEDDPANKFSTEKFEAGWRGYRNGAGDLLSERERALLPQAIGLVTLELACRFLTDYFEDSYFGWDDTRYRSRREHNLARCRGQIAEFNDMQNKKAAILEMARLR